MLIYLDALRVFRLYILKMKATSGCDRHYVAIAEQDCRLNLLKDKGLFILTESGYTYKFGI